MADTATGVTTNTTSGAIFGLDFASSCCRHSQCWGARIPSTARILLRPRRHCVDPDQVRVLLSFFFEPAPAAAICSRGGSLWSQAITRCEGGSWGATKVKSPAKQGSNSRSNPRFTVFRSSGVTAVVKWIRGSLHSSEPSRISLQNTENTRELTWINVLGPDPWIGWRSSTSWKGESHAAELLGNLDDQLQVALGQLVARLVHSPPRPSNPLHALPELR